MFIRLMTQKMCDMAQVSKGCLNERIIISLQEVIERSLKGNIHEFDNCRKIIFTYRQTIPYLNLYLRSESLPFNRFLCLVHNLMMLNIQEYVFLS